MPSVEIYTDGGCEPSPGPCREWFSPTTLIRPAATLTRSRPLARPWRALGSAELLSPFSKRLMSLAPTSEGMTAWCWCIPRSDCSQTYQNRVPRCFRWNGGGRSRRRKGRSRGPPGESPAGTTENNPAIYRWAQSRRPASPVGTKEQMRFDTQFLSPLRGLCAYWNRLPTVETVGYSRSSLRD